VTLVSERVWLRVAEVGVALHAAPQLRLVAAQVL
jgi:hypothetical protein